jgi:hypothetical protein
LSYHPSLPSRQSVDPTHIIDKTVGPRDEFTIKGAATPDYLRVSGIITSRGCHFPDFQTLTASLSLDQPAIMTQHVQANCR